MPNRRIPLGQARVRQTGHAAGQSLEIGENHSLAQALQARLVRDPLDLSPINLFHPPGASQGCLQPGQVRHHQQALAILIQTPDRLPSRQIRKFLQASLSRHRLELAQHTIRLMKHSNHLQVFDCRGFSSCCKGDSVVQLALVLDLSLPVATPAERLEWLYHERHLPLLKSLTLPSASPTAISLNSWLVQVWLSKGWEEGLNFLRRLYDFGRVEFCGTASHHAILPLVPEGVAFRQVRRNQRLLQQILHPEWRPAGFVPSWLAYGHEINRVLLPLGFRWCLADDSSSAALHGGVPGQHLESCLGMAIVQCSRLWSQRLQHLDQWGGAAFAREHQQELQGWLDGQDGYQVLWLPGESASTAQIQQFQKTHLKLGNQWVHPSHLLERFPVRDGDVPPGSALTPVDDFWSGRFFSPWDPEQPSWEVSHQAILALEALQDRLDELLSSSTFLGHSSQEGLQQLLQWCQTLEGVMPRESNWP